MSPRVLCAAIAASCALSGAVFAQALTPPPAVAPIAPPGQITNPNAAVAPSTEFTGDAATPSATNPTGGPQYHGAATPLPAPPNPANPAGRLTSTNRAAPSPTPAPLTPPGAPSPPPTPQ